MHFDFDLGYITITAQGLLYLCAQRSLLAVLREVHMVPGIEPGSATCKVIAVTPVLSLLPLSGRQSLNLRLGYNERKKVFISCDVVGYRD